ncbi:MAG: Sec-independent protein translocase protein TatB [Acidobacteriota bacterium]
MFGSIGFPEIIMIMLVVLMLFGPKKLPEIAKLLGNTVRDFKRTINDAKSTIQEELDKADLGDDIKNIKEDLSEVANLESSIKDSIKDEFKKFDITDDIKKTKKEIEDAVEEEVDAKN